MWARGRVGAEEVSLAFVPEVMPLVVVGLFGSVVDSPGGTSEVFVTFSELLR